jgi:GT2 family glycosyltransferase
LDWHNVIAEHRGVNEIDIHQFDSATTTDFATGCAMVIHNKVFREIGFFDERYYLYYEDLDFNVRAHKQGIHAWYCPEAFLWHKNAGSTDRPGNDFHQYYMTRNRLIFGLTYAPFRTKVALLKESLRFVLAGSVRQKQAIMDTLFKKFGRQYLWKK